MSVCIDSSKFLSKTVEKSERHEDGYQAKQTVAGTQNSWCTELPVTKRIYVRDIVIDIPKAGQATNEPLVPVGKKQQGKKYQAHWT